MVKALFLIPSPRTLARRPLASDPYPPIPTLRSLPVHRLGFNEPDPQNLHYGAIGNAVRKLTQEKKLDVDSMHLWLE